MKQADLIAVTTGALFIIWLIRTGRGGRIAGVKGDPVMAAHKATGSTGAFPVAPLDSASQKGKAIAARARSFVGDPTSKFNPQFPRLACASFVSETLVSLGLMKAEDPRCSGILSQLPGLGATRVGGGPAGGTSTRVGDLVFFYDSAGRLKHVEIAGGAGSSIGTSSSELKVGERPIGRRGYPTIDVWRF